MNFNKYFVSVELQAQASKVSQYIHIYQSIYMLLRPKL